MSKAVTNIGKIQDEYTDQVRQILGKAAKDTRLGLVGFYHLCMQVSRDASERAEDAATSQATKGSTGAKLNRQ